MIFSEDEECDSGAILLGDMDMRVGGNWEHLETDQTDEASHILLSHCISSSLVVNTIIFRKYKDSTDASLSGSHETSSSVF